jgi:thiol-disulfide isomerase/thioredoxin
MVNFNLKTIYVIILFNMFFFKAFAQNTLPINVSGWVNEPEAQYFSKPLIFVDFWATWCAPCISAMPHTETLSEIFKDDVLFLFLSNEPGGKVANFMTQSNRYFYSAVDTTNSTIDNYNVTALPYSILINPDGQVIWKGKPYEMTKQLLKQFVDLYKGQKGKVNRIIQMRPSKTQTDWQLFQPVSKPLYYRETNDVPNEFFSDHQTFYLSGDIKYIVSFMYDIPESHIISNLTRHKKYTFKYESDNLNNFKKALQDFVSHITPVKIEKKEELKEVYLLKETTTENFFNNQMYDYGQGDAAYLVDDFSVKIDNATIKQAAQILSEFSKHIFIYEGDNSKVYDWNLYYKNVKDVIKQLKEELGFEVTKAQKTLMYYYLYDGK